ncbi:MAG: hypothetical protein IPP83_01490 [Flavobacteriales bacterium]|nr:hypothetical protein [Flavobacteriales bacterium]
MMISIVDDRDRRAGHHELIQPCGHLRIQCAHVVGAGGGGWLRATGETENADGGENECELGGGVHHHVRVLEAEACESGAADQWKPRCT